MPSSTVGPTTEPSTTLVVQGPCVGPATFIIGASDLRLIHARNRIIKYADDTYLIVEAMKMVTVQEELDNFMVWAALINRR